MARAIVIGSSGGIGGALAGRLERDGWSVERLSRRGPPDRLLDLADEASIAAAAQGLAGLAPFDLILVATGMLHDDRGRGPEKSYRELERDRLLEAFAVNAVGPALIARHFLPLLPRDGRGVFACLSARVGSITDNRAGGWYGYRASKAALNMIVRTLAVELGRSRPQAICVGLHPGTVDTPLSAPFQRGVPPDRLFAPDFAARRLLEVIGQLTPEDSGGCFAWDGSPVPP